LLSNKKVATFKNTALKVRETKLKIKMGRADNGG
jgi:hypothetical protein